MNCTKLIINSLAILFLFSNCSQQIEFETNGEEIVLSDTFVTLSEALKKAEPFFASIENTATRSDDRKVKSIEYISQPNTRSTEKVLYYLVNFSDNKGFAILSSDNRLLPVYAFSDQGNLSLSDTIGNDVIASFISSLPSPSSSGGLIPNPVPSPTYVKEVSPLLSQPIQNLDRYSPLNKYCPMSQYGASAGCAAVASAMIMSYFEFPLTVNGISLNWNSIKNNPNNDAFQKLVADLGTSTNLDMSYNVESSCNPQNILRTFHNYGYQTPYYSTYSNSIAVQNLKIKKPVIVSGYQRDSGHVWVIDGLYVYTSYSMNPNNGGGTIKSMSNYMHCVWGFNGRYNGYYFHSTTNGFGGSAYDNENYEEFTEMNAFWSNNGIFYGFYK